MKIFIVFMALLIVNMGLITFQDDHTIYENMQYDIKRIADDCAYGSSMFYDMDAYSEGYLQYDTEEAVRYIETILHKRLDKDDGGAIEKLEYKAYFFNENGICTVIENGGLAEEFTVEYPYSFTDENGYEETVTGPLVKVIISAETGDIFRQDFLYANRVARSSSYGNKSY